MVHAAPRWIDYQVPDTLPDDTEESVVGTQWHQEAIAALAEMLDEIAIRRGTPWGVCNQEAIAALAEMLDEIAIRRGTPWGVCNQVALACARPRSAFACRRSAPACWTT